MCHNQERYVQYWCIENTIRQIVEKSWGRRTKLSQHFREWWRSSRAGKARLFCVGRRRRPHQRFLGYFPFFRYWYENFFIRYFNLSLLDCLSLLPNTRTWLVIHCYINILYLVVTLPSISRLLIFSAFMVYSIKCTYRKARQSRIVGNGAICTDWPWRSAQMKTCR